MNRDPWLSESVQDFIATEDHFSDSDLPPADRKEAQKNRAFVDFIVKDIVTSRESMADNHLKSSDLLKGIDDLVETAPELIEHFLNDHFTREVVDAVPGYVRRVLQLSRLEGARVPSQVTNGYLREAVRTYILGLPQACVALSRAALEQAIKEKLGLQLSGQYRTFQELLDDARKWHVLDGTMEMCAREVAKAGDDVMHEKPTTLTKAFDVLTKLRGVLRHIYSTEGHY